MANHEPFTDHMLVDWSYAGPPSGVGAQAHVSSVFAGRKEAVDIEVVSADAPAQIVERNVSAKGARVATGTYDLTELPDGGTRVSFTYAWERSPVADRLLPSLVRGALRRGNQRALARLAKRLRDA
jgi:hypothetical protein